MNQHIHYFDYLKEVRISSGRSMVEVSKSSQIGEDVSTRASLSLLSKVESGRVHDPRIATVVKLARAYRVPIACFEQFFNGARFGKGTSEQAECTRSNLAAD